MGEVTVSQPARERLLDALEELLPVFLDTPRGAMTGFAISIGDIALNLERERPGARDRALARMDSTPEAEARRRRERIEDTRSR